jgi:hypothetical protein
MTNEDQKKMLIRIHAVVAENSLPYYKYMVDNYLTLASGKHCLQFNAQCLDRKVVHVLRSHSLTHSIAEVYKYPKYFVIQNWRDILRALAARIGTYRRMAGSNGHSAGLASALAMSGQAIDIIADTDTVMLSRNWDQSVVECLETYGILGTCYEDIGGWSSGSGAVQTYKRKPNLTWCALSPRFDWSCLDPSPDKISNILINSLTLSALYNLPIGFELVRDVGWQVPIYLHDNKIPYAVFDQVKPTSERSLVLKTGIDYHEEYHWRNTPFIGHQRGSHKHPFRGNDISKAFYNACDDHMMALELATQFR